MTIHEILRQYGPMKSSAMLRYLPDMTASQISTACQKDPDIQWKGNKWNLREPRIATPRYAPEFTPLKYDLHANARLREGAMEFKGWPSRYA